jgi:hypothetical protein
MTGSSVGWRRTSTARRPRWRCARGGRLSRIPAPGRVPGQPPAWSGSTTTRITSRFTTRFPCRPPGPGPAAPADGLPPGERRSGGPRRTAPTWRTRRSGGPRSGRLRPRQRNQPAPAGRHRRVARGPPAPRVPVEPPEDRRGKPRCQTARCRRRPSGLWSGSLPGRPRSRRDSRPARVDGAQRAARRGLARRGEPASGEQGPGARLQRGWAGRGGPRRAHRNPY